MRQIRTTEEAEKLYCPFILDSDGAILCTCLTTKCMSWVTTREEFDKIMKVKIHEGYCIRLQG